MSDGRIYRHKRRGSEYVLIGYGRMQAESWSDWMLGANPPVSVDMREVAIYRSVDGGSLWVRPREEFEDGRFEEIESPARQGTPNPAREEAEALVKRTPDYVYDPEDWEYTHSWCDRGETVYDREISLGTVKTLNTLLEGPKLYAVEKVVTRDENGDPHETDWVFTFDKAEADAIAAAFIARHHLGEKP